MDLNKLRACVKASAFQLSEIEEVLLIENFTRMMEEIVGYERNFNKNIEVEKMKTKNTEESISMNMSEMGRSLEYDRLLMNRSLHKESNYIAVPKIIGE